MIYINDKVRINKFDNYNLVVEKLENVVNRQTNELIPTWKFCGYVSDLQSGLKYVLKKKLFNTNEEEIKLTDIITKTEKVINEFKEELKNIKIVDEPKKSGKM